MRRGLLEQAHVDHISRQLPAASNSQGTKPRALISCRKRPQPGAPQQLPSTPAGSCASLGSPAHRSTPALAARSPAGAGGFRAAPGPCQLRGPRGGRGGASAAAGPCLPACLPANQAALRSRGRDRAALPPDLQAPPKAVTAPCDCPRRRSREAQLAEGFSWTLVAVTALQDKPRSAISLLFPPPPVNNLKNKTTSSCPNPIKKQGDKMRPRTFMPFTVGRHSAAGRRRQVTCWIKGRWPVVSKETRTLSQQPASRKTVEGRKSAPPSCAMFFAHFLHCFCPSV